METNLKTKTLPVYIKITWNCELYVLYGDVRPYMHCFNCGHVTSVDYLESSVAISFCIECGCVSISREAEVYGSF